MATSSVPPLDVFERLLETPPVAPGQAARPSELLHLRVRTFERFAEIMDLALEPVGSVEHAPVQHPELLYLLPESSVGLEHVQKDGHHNAQTQQDNKT